MKIENSRFSSIQQVTGTYLNKTAGSPKTDDIKDISFDKVLQKKVNESEELKFSKHANSRISSRQINISDEQMQRLKDGANKAGEKGIKESLVIVDSLAFIVNTTHNTVITAMDQHEANDNIYTNIDGAVII